ncbi:MAG TPA: DUF167 domain-containing protein [Acidimicrobiales bacterium]
MRLTVHVHPGSSTPSVGGTYNGTLVVRVRARAVDGAATEAVLAALAQAFDVRPGAVRLVRGAASRTKVMEVDGDDEQLTRRLSELASPPPEG